MNNSVNRVAYNMDRRALYDRWSEPGQSAKYRGINVSGKTYASSRFVQKNNYLRMNSIRIMYNLNSPDQAAAGHVDAPYRALGQRPVLLLDDPAGARTFVSLRTDVHAQSSS